MIVFLIQLMLAKDFNKFLFNKFNEINEINKINEILTKNTFL